MSYKKFKTMMGLVLAHKSGSRALKTGEVRTAKCNF